MRRRRVVAGVVVLAVATLAASTLAGAQSTAPPPNPTITLTPNCIQDRPKEWVITATGTMPYRGANVAIVFDYGGSRPLTFTGQVDRSYRYSVQFSVPTANYPGSSWTVAAFQTEPDTYTMPETLARTTFRSPCTTPTTTSSSSSTVPDTTTSSTTTTTTTTVPTSVATLTVTPALGPPGFVTSARGTGFPPGPVALAWAPGLGTASATADAAGTFTVPVLILRKDRLGPRTLTAVGGSATASTTFLVVPASAQPRKFIARR